MIDFIKRLQDSKAVKMDYPNMFDESNILSLFGILDPSSKGYISYEKYLKGKVCCFFLCLCLRVKCATKLTYSQHNLAVKICKKNSQNTIHLLKFIK